MRGSSSSRHEPHHVHWSPPPGQDARDPEAGGGSPMSSASSARLLAGGGASFSFPRAMPPGHAASPGPAGAFGGSMRQGASPEGRPGLRESDTDALLSRSPSPPSYGTARTGHLPGTATRLPLVNSGGAFNLDFKGQPKLRSYYADLFHTLINIPNVRFYPLLLVAYALLFGVFAIPYYMEAVSERQCIPGVTTYLHAVWFSVQTSMTIGYGGDLTPDQDCVFVNVVIALQSVCSLLLAYSLLGVVYARFALPTRRESTMLFSNKLVLNEVAGTPQLSCRVANMRKHQVIEVNVRMLLAINNVMTEENESIFRFTSLPIFGGSVIFLALPCTVSHAITPQSPLHGMTLAMMQRADMQLIVLVEGVDASTSAKLQARHAYSAADIMVNYRFATMVSRCPNGRRLVDFSKFNEVVPVPETWTHPSGMSRTSSCSSFLDVPMILQYPTQVTLDKHGAIAGKSHKHRNSGGHQASHLAASSSGILAPRLEAAGRDDSGHFAGSSHSSHLRRRSSRLTSPEEHEEIVAEASEHKMRMLQLHQQHHEQLQPATNTPAAPAAFAAANGATLARSSQEGSSRHLPVDDTQQPLPLPWFREISLSAPADGRGEGTSTQGSAGLEASTVPRLTQAHAPVDVPGALKGLQMDDPGGGAPGALKGLQMDDPGGGAGRKLVVGSEGARRRGIFSIGNVNGKHSAAHEGKDDAGPTDVSGRLSLDHYVESEATGSGRQGSGRADMQAKLCADCYCVHTAYAQLELEAQQKVAMASEVAANWRAAAVNLAQQVRQSASQDPFLSERGVMKHLVQLSESVMSHALDA